MKQLKTSTDVFGEAIQDFFEQTNPEDISVYSKDFEEDILPISYLFRNFSEMPIWEQTALLNSEGRILDVGCGAGSHALYLEKTRKLNVTAIDTSKGAIKICKKRGLSDARNINFFDLKDEKFDTILLLMNGTGIIGTLQHTKKFFKQLSCLITENGKILIDSSDLRYLFEEDELKELTEHSAKAYYGEMTYQLSYKHIISKTFHWLFLDFERLKSVAITHDFTCKLLQKGSHFEYLAELKPRQN